MIFLYKATFHLLQLVIHYLFEEETILLKYFEALLHLIYQTEYTRKKLIWQLKELFIAFRILSNRKLLQ